MTPEAEARIAIDANLVAAGWVVQNYKKMNLGAARCRVLRMAKWYNP